jgi:hypothetical protein
MSDRSGRKPLGTVTRHPADWFSDYLYTAGHAEINQPSGSGEIYFAVSFLNSDQSGLAMRVYGATVMQEGGGGLLAFFVSGATGAPVGNAKSIRPDRPAPSVEVGYQFQQVALGVNNPFNFGEQFGALASDGFDSATILSPFPLFIVPQGYSLVLTNPSSSFNNGAFIWFQMAAQ